MACFPSLPRLQLDWSNSNLSSISSFGLYFMFGSQRPHLLLSFYCLNLCFFLLSFRSYRSVFTCWAFLWSGLSIFLYSSFIWASVLPLHICSYTILEFMSEPLSLSERVSGLSAWVTCLNKKCLGTLESLPCYISFNLFLTHECGTHLYSNKASKTMQF